MVHGIGDKVPRVKAALFLAGNAEGAGEVTLGEETSVWFSATVRADIAPITMGRVTIGHNAVLHGCTVGDGCRVGISAVVLSGAAGG